MMKTWILAAESSRAKLYSSKSKTAPLIEVETLVHPESRMHEGDLVSDRNGNDGGSYGQGPHAYDNKTTAHRHEHMIFARQIAERLEQGRTSGEFEALVLVAPPTFLGLLRDQMSKPLMAMVARQIDKNLVLQTPDKLRDQVWALH
jgi:protein required for attachment to host cells